MREYFVEIRRPRYTGGRSFHPLGSDARYRGDRRDQRIRHDGFRDFSGQGCLRRVRDWPRL
jgi:hypothetical protein